MANAITMPVVGANAQNGNVKDKTIQPQAICTKTTQDGDKRVDKSLVSQENIHPRISIAPLPGRLRMLVPPINFGAVETGSIYRSGYPNSKNFDFITSLNIRTIITLVPEPLSEDYITFMDQQKIRHYQIHIPANKDGKININAETMARALAVVLNRSHHPILVHCNRGKHRTGCVTACFRKTQYMSNEAALTEYRDYASPKCRDDDISFIKSFDPSLVLPIAQSQGWLPTPPPEPNEGFWHLKTDAKIPTFEDMAAITSSQEADHSVRIPVI